MTTDQFALYQYVFTERLGHLCGSGEPTFEQIEMAKSDANKAITDAQESENRA